MEDSWSGRSHDAMNGNTIQLTKQRTKKLPSAKLDLPVLIGQILLTPIFSCIFQLPGS
jgi:hypothetical protein